jgi:hypothetical protein
LRDDDERNEVAKWHDLEMEFGLIGGCDNPPFGFPDEIAAEVYWHKHGDRITAVWIANMPGNRPHGWWVFDPVAQALPEIPIKNREIFEKHEAELRAKFTLHGGRLLLWGYYHDQPAFLAEHGILTDAERQALED